jgi:hypothetical protein
MGLTGRSRLGQGIRVLEAVIPSEVEAATQPRNPSGQGQAFYPRYDRAVIPRDPSASLRSAQDGGASIRGYA